MKWKPPSQRVQNILIAPVAIPAAVALAAIILPVVPVIWAWDKWDTYRFRKPWHRWFAWRPVKLGAWYDKDRRWVWLEMVERVHDRFAAEGDWLYREPQGIEAFGGDANAAPSRSDESPSGKAGAPNNPLTSTPTHKGEEG